MSKKKTTIFNLVTGKTNTFPGKSLKGKERYQKLYHFTSFETFVRIWTLKELKFGLISNVNDIQESAKELSIQNPTQLPVLCAYQDILSSYKQISFTMDTDTYLKGFMNTMMWGYYADKTKGVCIEFDYDKLQFPAQMITGVVKYMDFPPHITEIPKDIKTQKEIRKYILKNRKKLFFSKQKGWKGENEYKIVSDSYDYLNIDGAISCVYLTSCTSKECQMVEQLVNDSVPVKFLYFNHDIPFASDTKTEREKINKAKNK